MRSFTWDEVWTMRLTRHSLLAPAPRTRLSDVAGAVCGIHAQMMPAAELSLGTRVAGVTRQDIRSELWERRGLVKTYGIRGTVHLFPARGLALWMAALRAGEPAREERRLAGRGLEPVQKEAVLEAIGAALDGRCLTRDELGLEVARRTGKWALDPVSPAFGDQWPRWQMALGAAAVAGVLCFGPNQGNRVTFVRPDQWIERWEDVDGTAALGEVFRRYLAAYGPATQQEFARWFQTESRVVTSIIEQLAGELEEVDVEGHRVWLLASDAAASWPPARDVVHLLPHFDCYVVGGRPREQFLIQPWRDRGLPTSGNVPTVVIDGRVAGLWRHVRKGRRLEIQVETLQPLTVRQHEQLEAAAIRIGEIAEAEAGLSLGAVEARPHL